MKRPAFPLQGGLYFSPKPLPHEAMTSWLLRTAAAHGCTWLQMISLLSRAAAGVVDPDFTWPWDIETSAAFFAVAPNDMRAMLSWSNSYVAQTRSFHLLRGGARAPAFGLCRQCVQDQNVAHFQVESRFAFVTLCPRHGTPLHTVGHQTVHDGHKLPKRHHDPGEQFRIRREKQLSTDRFAFERRMRAIVKSGFERHPLFGAVPAQTLLQTEAWRL